MSKDDSQLQVTPSASASPSNPSQLPPNRHDGIAGGELPVDPWVIVVCAIVVTLCGLAYLLMRFMKHRASSRQSEALPVSSQRHRSKHPGPPPEKR